MFIISFCTLLKMSRNMNSVGFNIDVFNMSYREILAMLLRISDNSIALLWGTFPSTFEDFVFYIGQLASNTAFTCKNPVLCSFFTSIFCFWLFIQVCFFLLYIKIFFISIFLVLYPILISNFLYCWIKGVVETLTSVSNFQKLGQPCWIIISVPRVLPYYLQIRDRCV